MTGRNISNTPRKRVFSYAGTFFGTILLTLLLIQNTGADAGIALNIKTVLALWATVFLALMESYLARHLKPEWLGL